MRAFLEEPFSGRFRISDDALPVVEEQLIPIASISASAMFHGDYMWISGLAHDDQTEDFKYKVDFTQFRISQYSNEMLTLILNPINSLYFENGSNQSQEVDDAPTCFEALKNKIEIEAQSQVFATPPKGAEGNVDGGVKKSVSLGFYFPSTRLFGLPEREDTFLLKNTLDKPYELFATDIGHMPENQ